MQISLETGLGTYLIQSYSSHEIKINNTVFKHSLIVSSLKIIEPWQPTDLEIILSLNPEVVLLGTGSHLKFPSPEKLSLFLERKIGIEVMDTGAACRTFNVLVSEGRNAVAALILD